MSTRPPPLSAAKLGLAVLCAALSLWFWHHPLLWPLKVLVVMLHETGHALATLLVGGEVTRVTLAANESGACLSRVPGSFLAEAAVYSAGYVGSAVFSGLLLIGTFRWGLRRELLALGSVWLATMGLLYGGDLFTVGFCGVFAVAFALAARFLPGGGVEALNVFLATFACLYVAGDLRDDLWNGAVRSRSDAGLLAQITLVPGLVWAALWTALSVGVLGGSAWLALRARRSGLKA